MTEQLCKECTAWAGKKWNLVGARLLSPSEEGIWGYVRQCLYVKGVQKFLSGFELQVDFLDSTPTPALILLY